MDEGGDHLRGEQGALVFGVARLSAGSAFAVSGRRRGFDDVGRGRLRGGGRVLSRGSELLLQMGDDGLQGVELLAQGIDLGLQSLTVRTGSRGWLSHASRSTPTASMWHSQRERLLRRLTLLRRSTAMRSSVSWVRGAWGRSTRQSRTARAAPSR